MLLLLIATVALVYVTIQYLKKALRPKSDSPAKSFDEQNIENQFNAHPTLLPPPPPLNLRFPIPSLDSERIVDSPYNLPQNCYRTHGVEVGAMEHFRTLPACREPSKQGCYLENDRCSCPPVWGCVHCKTGFSQDGFWYQGIYST